MDCARTAIRNGARHVTCYARRDEECISASEHEVRYAKLEGVGFRFCKAPVEIRENGIICRDTVKGEDGRFTQVEGSETFYPHTGVIVSVSQGSESTLVKTTTGIETNQRGLLTVNEDGNTTREGACRGGDAVMGARTVVERRWTSFKASPSPPKLREKLLEALAGRAAHRGHRAGALLYHCAGLRPASCCAFLLGAVLIVVGIMFFYLGAEMSMTPMGERVGACITRSQQTAGHHGRRLSAGLPHHHFGAGPAGAGQSGALHPQHDPHLLGGGGRGPVSGLAFLRMLLGVALPPLLVVFYGLVFVLAPLCPGVPCRGL